MTITNEKIILNKLYDQLTGIKEILEEEVENHNPNAYTSESIGVVVFDEPYIRKDMQTEEVIHDYENAKALFYKDLHDSKLYDCLLATQNWSNPS